MPIRYMGTKRHVAHRVRRLVEEIKPRGRVVDLFSGVGSVAESLVGLRSVVTNDALAFTASFARARFTADARAVTAGEALSLVRPVFRDQAETLARRYKSRLRAEETALEGGRTKLATHMAETAHVANSDWAARQAREASRATGPDHYRLVTLYFASGYFGLRQAIQLDALRFAIDESGLSDHDRDWLIGAWIAAAATVANAPGHTAQYLKPNTEEAFKRIRRCWRRSVWAEFQDRLIELKLVGTKAWRKNNRAEVSDALQLLRSGTLSGVGIVYADPPYTKDQYSRYYHVYESLYLYDYPDARGEGRTRSDRFSTDFCLKTAVTDAFAGLFDSVAELGVPLILSYPSCGLLVDAGSSVRHIAAGRLEIETIETFAAEHSTLGASKGSSTKRATENLYVCRPA